MNTATAVLVTDPVVVIVPPVPESAALTLAIVAASASNDASTLRIDWICGAERPEVGVTATTGVAGVALEFELELEPPLLVLLEVLVILEQRVVLGVIVTVRAAVPTYLTTDCVESQELVTLSADTRNVA